MTNPFKSIAVPLGARGALFLLLGLVLLARAVPTFLSMDAVPNIPAAVIGIFLLGIGVADLIRAAQRMTPLRKEKVNYTHIDAAYSKGESGQEIPSDLMDQDANPNERDYPTTIEWLTRVFPKIAYTPPAYVGILHSILIASLLGVMGVIGVIALRVVLAGSLDGTQLSLVLDWSLWFYFLAGFVFWAAISRFGFRRALHYGRYLRGGRMVGIFVLALGAAVFFTLGSVASPGTMPAPPSIGVLTTILLLGSLAVIVATGVLIFIRIKRAPDHYSVYRGEEFVTVGMHPTDMINVIKAFTSKMSGGTYSHLGSWKPKFAEHTAVSAGQFDAILNAETSVAMNENTASRPEKRIGVALAWGGLAVMTLAGLFLFRAASTNWASPDAVFSAVTVPIALMVFGALLYRLGLVPIAEQEWTSVVARCKIDGTFQTQGGMALMNAGDQSIKGSVLTSATVQPQCAYLTSVGFMRPGSAKHLVVRMVDQVEPAEPVAKEMLAAIHHQAQQMMGVGTQLPPMQISLEDQSDDAPEPPAEDRPSTH